MESKHFIKADVNVGFYEFFLFYEAKYVQIVHILRTKRF